MKVKSSGRLRRMEARSVRGGGDAHIAIIVELTSGEG
jgi:hypothetical protein